MYKKEFKFKNLNDEDVKVTHYFNLSKPEIVRLEVSRVGGFANMMNTIIENVDAKEIIDILNEFILMSVGRKSADGNKFEKNGAADSFKDSIPYDMLFDELMTDPNAMANFIKAIVPADLSAGITPEALREMGIEYVEQPKGETIVSAAPLSATPPPAPAETLYRDIRQD